MADWEERYVLHRSLQTDDAYLRGERSAGKAGCGSEDKIPFVVAVSLTVDTHPLRVKLPPVTGSTFHVLKAWAGLHLAQVCSRGP